MANDTRRAFRNATNAMEPELRRAFLQAIVDVKSTAQMQVIQGAIDRGDIQAVVNALNLGPEFFAPLDDAVRNAFIRGAAYQINTLPPTIPTSGGGPLIVRFQGQTPRAEAIVADLGGSLIVEITDDQRALVTQVVRDGIANGRGADQVALDLVGRTGASGRREGGLIGLTSREAGYVMGARADLDNLDASYFNRQARDKSFDATVRKAIESGKPLARADVERILARYSDRLLQRRGHRIARTETIGAMNAGRREAVQQMIDSGKIPASAVKRIWDATGDARTRLDHLTMEEQTVAWGVPFIAPDGSRLMGPADQSLGAAAAQVINCRCHERYDIDFLSLAV